MVKHRGLEQSGRVWLQGQVLGRWLLHKYSRCKDQNWKDFKLWKSAWKSAPLGENRVLTVYNPDIHNARV